GKLEDALKGARGDALIENFAVVLFRGLLFALDRQRVLFRLKRKFVFAETGDRDADAVIVLAGAFDVVGRVARGGLEAIQHRKQPVKTDGGTIEGSKIECTHGISSCLTTCGRSAIWPGRIRERSHAWIAENVYGNGHF